MTIILLLISVVNWYREGTGNLYDDFMWLSKKNML